MTEEQIRTEILKIQNKYYTPTSKIAKDCDVNRSLISQMLNQKFDKPMYKNVLESLEEWLQDRML
ncbi:MAG: hypothetical protein FH753_00900 [Firmicutes bacterium]|nr:hypothetical protein [Bacillota bacterium]